MPAKNTEEEVKPIDVLRRALQTRHDLAESLIAALDAAGFEIVAKQ